MIVDMFPYTSPIELKFTKDEVDLMLTALKDPKKNYTNSVQKQFLDELKKVEGNYGADKDSKLKSLARERIKRRLKYKLKSK